MGKPEKESSAPQASAGNRNAGAAGDRQRFAPASASHGSVPDRRRVQRKPARTFGLIHDADTGDQIGIAAVIDLSTRGAGIRMTEPLTRGAFVRFTVEKKLSVARVKHCLKDEDDYFRIGLEFTAA
jgi:hypothetical protein